MNYSLFFILLFLHSLNFAISLTLNLQLKTLTHDFILDSVSQIYQQIPFQIPTINICFGTPNKQCFDMALSINLLHSIIESEKSECKHFKHQFNSNLSLTFDDKTWKSTVGFCLFNKRDYFIIGKICLDTISMNGREPFENKLSFVLADSDHQFPSINIDGYLGLQKYSYDQSRSENFLSSLYQSGIIKNQVFTFNYTSHGGSKVSFGEKNTTKYNTCDTSNKIISRTDWFCEISTIQMGDLQLNINENVAFFDSESSAVYASFHLGLYIFNYIQLQMINENSKQCNIQEEGRYMLLICSLNAKISNIPKMHIKMSSAEIVIDWSNLMKLTEVNGEMVYVSLFIVDKNDDQYWHIGLSGFIDHSIYFDKDNLQIGIMYLGTGNKNTSKGNSNYSKKVITLVIIIVLSLGLIQIVFKKKLMY